MRSHPAEHSAAFDGIGERFGARLGQRRRVDVGLPSGQARTFGDRADRDVVVAADHLHGHTFGCEVLERGWGIGAHDVFEQHEGDCGDGGQRCVVAVAERAVGSCQHEDALPRSGMGFDRGLHVARVARCQHVLGRAQHPTAVVGERHAAPLASRRERHPARGRPRRGIVVRVLQGARGCVRVGVELRERGERRVDAGSIGRVDDLHIGEGEHALGDRAGLVDAQHVDAGEHLDRGKLLHEAPVSGEPNHADGEGDARQQHQTFGNHSDQAGNGADDRLLPAFVAAQELATGKQ